MTSLKSFPLKVNGAESNLAESPIYLCFHILDFRVADDVEEPNVWEDNWDDDNVEDDFSQQLKAHLESKKMET